jgi:hypothetical protein
LANWQAANPTLDFESEIAYLRKKYDSAKKELNRKDEVINQYAVKVCFIYFYELSVIARSLNYVCLVSSKKCKIS